MVGLRASSLLLLVVLLAGAAPAAQAQQYESISSCGDGFTLFIRNPDIVPDPDGVFHVSGQLLVQFQVIGERADEVEAFGLSFGADVPTDEEVCDLPPPAWLTGLYLESYSLDKDKSDGFFIGINSNGDTSPQYDLGVAVHAYDGNGDELARFWGIVRLDHCDMQPSLGCPDDPEAPDFTAPWPIILPGDGEVRPVQGFVMEFNEELSDLVVELNGEDVTDRLSEWTDRPDWDRDSAPAGPQMAIERAVQQCSGPSPIHECGPLAGPAYQWTERDVTDADVIRVVATDMAGNVATKEIHIGSSVAGGTISDGLPILQMTFENSTVAAAPGETAVFRMTMENNGGGEGHPFASADVPAGWSYEWVPGHEPVPAGGESRQELHVTVPDNATEGLRPVRAIVDYRQGTQDKTLESALNVQVTLPEEADAVEPDAAEGPSQDSPLGSALVPLLLAGAALAMRRTRK